MAHFLERRIGDGELEVTFHGVEVPQKNNTTVVGRMDGRKFEPTHQSVFSPEQAQRYVERWGRDGDNHTYALGTKLNLRGLYLGQLIPENSGSALIYRQVPTKMERLWWGLSSILRKI